MKRFILISLLLVAGTGLFVAAAPAYAQTPANGGCQNGVCTYVPLEPLPGVNQNGINFAGFVSGMFRLLITLGALFAVLMLVIAGIGYMIAESGVNIKAAKDRATAALYGLLLLTACWLILYTINPNLLRFDLFSSDVPAVANSGAPGTTAPTSPNTALAGLPCGNSGTACSTGYYCATGVSMIGDAQYDSSCVPNINKDAEQGCSADGGTWTQGWIPGSSGQYCYLPSYKDETDCKGHGYQWNSSVIVVRNYCYK